MVWCGPPQRKAESPDTLSRIAIPSIRLAPSTLYPLFRRGSPRVPRIPRFLSDKLPWHQNVAEGLSVRVTTTGPSRHNAQRAGTRPYPCQLRVAPPHAGPLQTMNPPSQTPDELHEPGSNNRNPSSAASASAVTSLPKRSLSAMSTGKETHKEGIPFNLPEEIQSEDMLGQFSYAPATQTTVVTTTTTTTTQFPPLRMKAPQHLNELDPKQYPLASSPTPQSIKELHFNVEGRPAIFQEMGDTAETLAKVCASLVPMLNDLQLIRLPNLSSNINRTLCPSLMVLCAL